MTSNDSVFKPVKNKSKLKGGAKIEFNDKYLDQIFHIINIKKELAMQFISNDQTGRSDTI